jgi:hypothetical protein
MWKFSRVITTGTGIRKVILKWKIRRDTGHLVYQKGRLIKQIDYGKVFVN